jgi:hypothetical protein
MMSGNSTEAHRWIRRWFLAWCLFGFVAKGLGLLEILARRYTVNIRLLIRGRVGFPRN